MQCGHPNLVQVYGLEEIGDELLLSMEFVDGMSLADFSRKTLDIELAAYLGLQALEGLCSLHENSEGPILHADISPGNLLLSRSGYLKLVDFGVARTLQSERSGKTLPMANWRYAAPEKRLHDLSTRQGDIFSLALVLLELTGLPIESPDPAKDLSRHLVSLNLNPDTATWANTLRPWIEAETARRPDSTRVAAESLRPFILHDEARLRARLAELVDGMSAPAKGFSVQEAPQRTKPLPVPGATPDPARPPIKKTILYALGSALLTAAAVLLLWVYLPSPAPQTANDPIAQDPRQEDATGAALLPVDSRPASELFVDGALVGKTPQRLRLSPGRHVLGFSFDGDTTPTQNRQVFLRPGANEELFVKR